MSLLEQKKSIVHPILFAFFPVIFLFSNNISELNFVDIILPSLIIIATALLGWYVLGKVSKNYIKSGLVVSLFLFLFFSYGHFYNILQEIIIDTEFSIGHKIPIISLLVLFSIITTFIIFSKRKFDNLTRIVNGIVIVMIILSMVNISSFYISNYNISENDVQFIKVNNTDSKLAYPNIYYIILDGYGSNKYLQKFFGFDNSEFLDTLRNKGFFVPEDSKSNYPTTAMSISSSTNMRYVNELIPESGNVNFHRFYNLISNNAIMNYAKSKGYEVFNIDSGFAATRYMNVVHHNVCGTVLLINSELSSNIFGISMLKPVYAQFFEHYDRERVLCAFSQLNQIHQNAEKPFFVFAHIVSPHIPYIFGSNGEAVSPDNLEFGNPNNHKDVNGYVNQLQFINKKLLETIENILINDSSTIIIIQSDHGTRYSIDYTNPSDDGIREKLSILNVYYFPDKKYDLIGEKNTPVNTFRLIFNEYVDGEFEILGNKNYFININQKPVKLWEVTDIVN